MAAPPWYWFGPIATSIESDSRAVKFTASRSTAASHSVTADASTVKIVKDSESI